MELIQQREHKKGRPSKTTKKHKSALNKQQQQTQPLQINQSRTTIKKRKNRQVT